MTEKLSQDKIGIVGKRIVELHLRIATMIEFHIFSFSKKKIMMPSSTFCDSNKIQVVAIVIHWKARNPREIKTYVNEFRLKCTF